jgi:hypothetical protein
MSRAKTHKAGGVLGAGLACLFALPILASAAEPVQLSGAITGRVVNTAGVPQMGATVTLYNRQERVYEKALSDERGEFKFLGLFPDVYSLRVTLASFVPAIKRNILVQPGMRSVMAVNLNTLFSSIQLAYPPVENGSLMTDDWKWILRSASATRPVLRFTGDALAKTSSHSSHGSAFSDTRGMLQLSAGDGPLFTGVGSQADLGTAFALATSLFGHNLLEVSGNLGYGSQSGVPVAAFRTTYSHSTGGDGPEVSVTMRQLLMPGSGSEGNLPMLRTVSASYDDHAQISDNLSVQYGFTLDSVSFVDHLNTFSPYARLVYSLGDQGEVTMAYTSGNARPDLASGSIQESDLQRDLSTLGLFPRLSLLNGQAKMQQGQELELSYTRKMGSRAVQFTTYHESVTNAALNLVAPDGMFGTDILPDLFSNSAIFNAGNYQSTGYTASLTQNLGEHASATVMYGTMGALTVDNNTVPTGSPAQLRSMLRSEQQQAVTWRVAATAPTSGTQLIASYQWAADSRAVMPGWLYSTQSLRPVPGLNVYVRQPIPISSALPWRMEATADLRNLLAQGYLPLTASNGQPIVLVQMPRSFRGGLSFIF